MPSEKKVLVIEDDGQTRRMAKLALESIGARVIEADGAVVGFHLFQQHEPDLVVLDILLPDGDGMDVCRRIRAHKNLSATPVIVLTGRGQMEDKETGFESGADQYLVKPVHPKELVLWVQALLRRRSLDKDEGPVLEAGEVEVDLQAHLVRFRGATIADLTGKEFELFAYLVKKRPKVLSRKHILTNLWHTVAVDNVVDTHVSNLRRKLPPEIADKIQTVPGKGFRYFES